MPLLPLYSYLPRPRRRIRRHMTLLLLLILCVSILLTPVYTIYKPPSWLISLVERHWPDVLFRLPLSKASTSSTRKIIALTIDDAPSDHTRDILKLLAEYDAHATFFVIGSQVAGREDIVKDIVKGGHELANHAWRDEPSASLPPSDLRRQILEVDALISTAYSSVSSSDNVVKHALRPSTHWFRPGSGFFNTKMRDLVRELDYKIALGSVYPHDPQIPYPAVNARHVLSMVTRGSVVIMHDRRAWSVPMLEKVLPELKRRGFEVMGLSDALENIGA